jgi:hypothetical protein
VTGIQEYNDGLDDALGTVAEVLQRHIDDNLPGAEGRIWQGHPVWLRGEDPIVGYKAFPRWVTLMIWSPAVSDPSGTLVGGDRMSTIKYESADQVDPNLVDTWLAEVQARL